MSRPYFGGHLGPYFPFKSPELSVPFDLLRAHLYPRDPSLVAVAVEEYGEARGAYQQPQYLPQRMGFRRHKKSPYASTWEQAVTSPVRAVTYGNMVRDRLAEEALPLDMLSPREAALARGALRLPQPSDNLTLARPEAVKDAPPPPSVSVARLDQLAAEESFSPEERQYSSRSRAISEVLAKLHCFGAMVGR